jgi:hypothetical protein
VNNVAYLTMTPPIDYEILDYNLSDVYYKYNAGKRIVVYKGIGKVYNRFKNMVLKEKGEICSKCGLSGNVIHHKKPANKYPDLYYCVDNIMVVCESCHKRIHQEEGY